MPPDDVYGGLRDETTAHIVVHVMADAMQSLGDDAIVARRASS